MQVRRGEAITLSMRASNGSVLATSSTPASLEHCAVAANDAVWIVDSMGGSGTPGFTVVSSMATGHRAG